MERGWIFSLGHYLGGEVRKGGCGGIVNGIRDDSIACRGFLAFI
jgi:hypothetical protein